MAKTVISIFELADQALEARNHLLSHGFLETQVSIKTASYTDGDSEAEESDPKPDLLDHITSFFKDLFGADHEEISKYAAVGKNRTIVTVHTDTNQDAEQVAEILDHYGALNVNETAGSFFPQNNEKISHAHSMDHPDGSSSASTISDKYDENRTRASVIKSRIIERSVAKNDD